MDDDFSKNMEKIMLMSKMMKNGGNFDMDTMMDFMGETENDTDRKSAKLVNCFDECHKNSAFEGIKACIPYLEFKHQKNLAIFIKLMEMQQIIDIYREKSKHDNFCDKKLHRGMIAAIRPFVKDDKAQLMDNLLKILTIKEMMEG